jgi:hypothetical protein
MQQVARTIAESVLSVVRQFDSLLASGAIENARCAVEDAARRRAISEAHDAALAARDKTAFAS